MQTKVCNRCEVEKPISEFHKSKRGLYGVHSTCKQCKNERRKELYWSRVEDERKRMLDRYHAVYKNDPIYKEYAVRKAKKWAEENREHTLERHRHYWHNKVDKDAYKRRRNKRRRERFRTDPTFRERRRASGRQSAKIRRYQVRGAEGSHTAKEWRELCEKYDFRCLCCGQNKPLVRDHVIPISKGGSNDISNIQPLCQPCNMKKFTDTTDYRPSEGG